MLPIRSILVPIDRSEPSRAAIELSIDFADRLGAELTFLCIDRDAGTSTRIFVERPSVMLLPGVAKVYAHQPVARLISALEDAGTVHYGPVGHAGSTAATIAEASGEFDLVVVGTHGRRGAAHIVHGSVAEDVMRHSLAPVLVVRGRERPAAAPAPA